MTPARAPRSAALRELLDSWLTGRNPYFLLKDGRLQRLDTEIKWPEEEVVP